MKTSECLVHALYGPLKYIANSGEGPAELVSFCRIIIGEFERSSNDVDYSSWHDHHGKDLEKLLYSIIRSACDRKTVRIIGFNINEGNCIVCGANLKGVSHAIIDGQGYHGSPCCHQHLSGDMVNAVIHFDADDHSTKKN